MENLALSFFGMTLLAISVWSWRGKSHAARWWTRRRRGDDVALMALPTLGLMSTGGALGNLGFSTWIAGPLAFSGLVVGPWAFIVSVASLLWWPARRAWGPRWYTHQTQAETRNALTDPLSTYARATTAAPAETRKPRWLGTPFALWHGARIIDVHTPSRRDAIMGTLRACDGGIWFDAPGAPDGTRETATATIPWSDIVTAHAVRGSDNPHGDHASNLLHRSLLPRLAITTIHDHYLFEIALARATTAANTITSERNLHNAS